MTIPNEAWAVAGVIITSVLTWMGVRVKANADKSTARIAADSPNWSSFVQEVKDENRQQKSWLEGRVTELSEQVKELRSENTEITTKMTRLESMFQAVELKYSHAVDAIRRYRHYHPDSPVRVHPDVYDDL